MAYHELQWYSCKLPGLLLLLLLLLPLGPLWCLEIHFRTDAVVLTNAKCICLAAAAAAASAPAPGLSLAMKPIYLHMLSRIVIQTPLSLLVLLLLPPKVRCGALNLYLYMCIHTY
jgi:hypothetical protein